jgi:hypothetical protein
VGWLTRPQRLRPKLAPGEDIVAASEATATGTGRAIGIATGVGILVGLLYPTTDAGTSLWPSLALGGFVGVVAGYVWAWILAHGRSGPGAVTLAVVMTNERLILLRLSASLRSSPLRSFTLSQIDRISTKPAPVGQYGRVRFHTTDATIDLFVRTLHDFAALHREHSQPQRVD